MTIINNRTVNNHESKLLSCFKSADEVIIVSPFLAKSFKFFGFAKNKHLKKITLITTLKNDYNDQQCKINFFKNLFEFGKKEVIDIEILIDNSLHGKIYIFKKENDFINAIITSANFTSNGLKLNNEWGIEINDSTRIEEIANDLISNIVLEPISATKLIDIEAEFNSIPPPTQKVVSSLKLVDNLKLKNNPLEISGKSTFWLKPIGATKNFISLNEKFSDPYHDLYFARNPKSVKIGDILIAYAVGYKKVLSIFRVSSSVKYSTNPKDRWHYFVSGENLTRYYGNEWNKHIVHISDEKHYFIIQTKMNATPSGKNTYGTLQRGGDKLKITNEFGNYLTNKIVEINKDVSFREDYI